MITATVETREKYLADEDRVNSLAVMHVLSQYLRRHDGPGSVHRRLLIDSDGIEFHRHDSPHARSRPHLVPSALVHLGDVRYQHHPGAGHGGDSSDDAAGCP